MLDADHSGSRAGQVAGELSRLRGDLDVARATLSAAQGRQTAAEQAVKRAEAADLADKASDLRDASAARPKRTQALLAQLAEHEGVEYAPAPDEPVYADGVAVPAFPPVTKTERMLTEAGQLDARAAALDTEADRDAA